MPTFQPSAYSYGGDMPKTTSDKRRGGKGLRLKASGGDASAGDIQVPAVEEEQAAEGPKVRSPGVIVVGLVTSAGMGALFGGASGWLLKAGVKTGAKIGAASALLAGALPAAMAVAAMTASRKD